MPGSLTAGENDGVRSVHTRAALTGLVFAAPAFVVLLPGGWLDERGEGMTRNVEPPDLPNVLHVALLVVAAVALVGSLFVLLSRTGRRACRRADLSVAWPLLVAALYVGVTYKVATAAVSGANIGAGLLFMLGVVTVPPLLALAGFNAVRTNHSA
ncbi:MAG TPA: hypothetical protein DCS55_01295 [Acidimicrobiaceae bacterium]|nr:hypothetical protein [Acidimicrobiaceae bacterium]